jgi:hypothetical protein
MQGWQAMGTLLLGLVVGLAAGYVLGRRTGAASADAAATTLPVPAPPPAGPAPVPGTPAAAGPTVGPLATPNKRAKKVGLTEADFLPADDILHRMQVAWQQGVSLDELEAIERGSTPAGTTDHPPDTTDDDRLERVLRHLDRPAPPTTVTEAVAQLEADGYGEDLRWGEGGRLACHSCGASHATDIVEVDRVLRFEGPSDPADEAIVLALRCPACGARGALVSAFGPDADPELAEAFAYLASRARHR